MKNNKALDFPWGIVCGICAIIVFFGITAFIAIYLITSGIAEQTSEAVSAFENWYQVLIFIVDILMAITAIGSLVMYIMREKAYKNFNADKAAESDMTAKEDKAI